MGEQVCGGEWDRQVRVGGWGESFKPNRLKLSKKNTHLFYFSRGQREKKFPKQKLKSGLRKKINKINYQPPWFIVALS